MSNIHQVNYTIHHRFYRNEIENMKMIKSVDSETNSNSKNGSSSHEAEKQQRRELMAKAAMDREKGWDRRVAAAGKRGGLASMSNMSILIVPINLSLHRISL